MGTLNRNVTTIKRSGFNEYTIQSEDIPSAEAIIAKANEGISEGIKYSFTNGSTDVTTWDGQNPEGQKVTQSTTFYAEVKINTYTATFEWNKFDREDEVQHNIEFGNSPTEPDTSWIDPNSGYIFVGWTVNGVDIVTFPYPIYCDTDFTAKWEEDIAPETGNITFKVRYEDDDTGDNITWNISDQSYNKENVILPYTLTANDIPGREVIINSTPDTEMYEWEDNSWEINTVTGAPYVGKVLERKNNTFYALVTKYSYVVRFVHNDGTDVVDTIYPDHGDEIEMPSITYEHHQLNGWLNNDDLYQVGSKYVVKSNETFTAQWTTDSLSVSFYSEGSLIATIPVEYNGTVTPPTVVVSNPDRLRFKDSWKRRDNNEVWTNERFASENITQSMTFDAVIVNLYKVRFHTATNSPIVDSQRVEENTCFSGIIPSVQTINNKVAETTNGLLFMENEAEPWRVNGRTLDSQTCSNNWITTTPVTASIVNSNSELVFYARLSAKVTFDFGEQSTQADEEITVEIRTILNNSQIPVPNEVTGYRFTGWSGNISQEIMENTTFVAQWEKIDNTKCIVKFYAFTSTSPIKTVELTCGNVYGNNSIPSFNEVNDFLPADKSFNGYWVDDNNTQYHTSAIKNLYINHDYNFYAQYEDNVNVQITITTQMPNQTSGSTPKSYPTNCKAKFSVEDKMGCVVPVEVELGEGNAPSTPGSSAYAQLRVYKSYDCIRVTGIEGYENTDGWYVFRFNRGSEKYYYQLYFDGGRIMNLENCYNNEGVLPTRGVGVGISGLGITFILYDDGDVNV